MAKQLSRHMKFQRSVKSQFEKFVGNAGRIAIKGLNRVTSASNIQPLRKQPSKLFNGSKLSMRSKGSRNCRSVVGMTAKSSKISRLRYAPHLVGSSPSAYPDDAREALNIIVNERHRPSSSCKSGKSKRRSRSRDSEGRVMKIHRLLSADRKYEQKTKKMMHQ